MNIISKLFGKNKTKIQQNSTVQETVDISDSSTINSAPDIDLSVDAEEPLMSSKNEPKQSRLNQFLNRNYQAIGVYEGFEYHSSDQLKLGKSKIEAEFRLLIDIEIQEKVETRLQLENLITDVGLISPLVLQKLQNTLQKLIEVTDNLERQKCLSIEEDGWVMNAIYNYHQGFTRGLSDYIESEKLLNSIKHI